MACKNIKQEKSQRYISEAIIIAVASASAYYFSYTYEKSFLSYFGVPHQFISIDLTTILSFGVIVFGVLIFTFPVLNMFTILLSRTKNEHLLRLVRPYWIFLFLIIVHLYFFGIEKWTWLISYLSVFFVFIFFDFIFPLITQKGKKSYTAKLQAQEKVDSKIHNIPHELGIKYGRDTLILILLFLLGYFVSSNAGLSEALRQKDYLFITADPQCVVLRIYSDRLICAQYDDVNNTVHQQFSIIKIGENPLTLSLRSVGPISPAATLTPTSPSIIPSPTIVVPP